MNYEKEAQDLIKKLERDSLSSGETTEQFYRGLREMIDALRERLEVAHDELPREVAQEITRGRR